MARQHYATGNEGDIRRNEAIIRLCRRATEIDPELRARLGADGPRADARALHARRGKATTDWPRPSARSRSTPTWPRPTPSRRASSPRAAGTTRRPPKSRSRCASIPSPTRSTASAAYLSFRQQRLDDAIRHFEKALALMETDVSSANMLIDLLHGARRHGGRTRARRRSRSRAPRRPWRRTRTTARPWASACYALALLGQAERAKGWMSRALLIDPDNMNMRYNFACALTRPPEGQGCGARPARPAVREDLASAC